MEVAQGPSAAALLVALPATLDDLICAVESKQSDYAANLVLDDLRTPEQAWANGYQGVASAVLDLIETARKVGIHTFDRPTIMDVRRATSRFSTVVLVGHWKGHTIAPRDIVGAPLSMMKALSRALDVRHHKLAEYLIEQVNNLDSWRSPDLLLQRDALATACNRAIDTNLLLSCEPLRSHLGAACSTNLSRALQRDLMTELFDGELLPGNRLELTDGMHSAPDVIDAVYSGFVGTLDFSACQSTVLADTAGLVAGERFLSFSNASQLEPRGRLALLKATFNAWKELGGPYPSVRMSIEAAILNHLTSH